MGKHYWVRQKGALACPFFYYLKTNGNGENN